MSLVTIPKENISTTPFGSLPHMWVNDPDRQCQFCAEKSTHEAIINVGINESVITGVCSTHNALICEHGIQMNVELPENMTWEEYQYQVEAFFNSPQHPMTVYESKDVGSDSHVYES